MMKAYVVCIIAVAHWAVGVGISQKYHELSTRATALPSDNLWYYFTEINGGGLFIEGPKSNASNFRTRRSNRLRVGKDVRVKPIK